MREKVLGREGPYPLFGQLVGIWKSHDKAQAKSLDDRGCVGYLLDIDMAEWDYRRSLPTSCKMAWLSKDLHQDV